MNPLASLSARDLRLLDLLTEAYITQSMMIRLEHEKHGSCEHRDGDLEHEAMHDAMRNISHAILELVPHLVDVPEIRYYIETKTYEVIA